MKFVEINDDREPTLTGGRRGSSTLKPGGTNVTNNLVPVSELPASAGNLAVAFDKIKKGRKSGGLGVRYPDGHIEFTDTFNVGRPRGGKASVSVPAHGHGANTQIGTNYKLAQSSGPTLSPAVSTMSVGGKRRGRPSNQGGSFLDDAFKMATSPAMNLLGKGRKPTKKGGAWYDSLLNVAKTVGEDLGMPFKKTIGVNPFTIGYDIGHDIIGPAIKRKVGMGRVKKPKGKDLLRLIKYMADTKAKLHGMKTGGSWWSSAWDVVKDVGKQLIDKHGEAILNKGKDLLLAEIGKRADAYIGAGVMRGGAFYNDISSVLQSLMTPALASQLGAELVGGGWFDDIVSAVKNVGEDLGKPFKATIGVNPFTIGYDIGHDVIAPELKKSLGMGPNDVIKFGQGREGMRKIGGAKKPSARGAIVSKIMKEKNLSLPMASKYVKEHGLY